MKHFSILGLVLAFLTVAGCTANWNSAARAPLPNEDDFRSVLLLGDGNGHQASGFVLVRNGKQYVVTAKHFAHYMSGRDSVEIFVNGGWVRSPTYLVGHGKEDLDISVFSFAMPTVPGSFDPTPTLAGNDSLSAGCEVWYLGFPLGYLFDDPHRNYPFPLIKHAYLSAQNGNPLLFYFDGLCNPGFSGGPVYALTAQGSLRLIGVVSARLKETDASNSQASSGIFLAYSSRYAEQLIDANPIGAAVR